MSASVPRAGTRRRDLAGAADEQPARRGPAGRRWRRFLGRHWTALFGLGAILLLVACALFAPWLAPYDPLQQDLRNRLVPPFWQAPGTLAHPLGTDQLGRDVLSRLIYGARISLTVAFFAVLISGLVGVVVGLLAGFYGGPVDMTVMRLAELQLTLPFLLLALLVLAVFGTGLRNIIIVLSISGWAVYGRVVRAEVRATSEQLYVEAARATGIADGRLLVRHILPSIVSTVTVLASFSAAAMIIQESALAFLGLGVAPDIPSWGGMLADGRDFLTVAWWLGVLPGLTILAVVLSMNLLGDWLRDLLDPVVRHG
jgi:peptide/nickel transport system permease protein